MHLIFFCLFFHRDLSFLGQFKKLNSLILDHNKHMDITTFPNIPTLKLLWINNCKILNLFKWVQKVSICCPNLRILCMMGNPGNSMDHDVSDYADYRKCVINFFPKLIYLDDMKVTPEERQNVQAIKTQRRINSKSIVEMFKRDQIFRGNMQLALSVSNIDPSHVEEFESEGSSDEVD